MLSAHAHGLEARCKLFAIFVTLVMFVLLVMLVMCVIFMMFLSYLMFAIFIIFVIFINCVMSNFSQKLYIPWTGPIGQVDTL